MNDFYHVSTQSNTCTMLATPISQENCLGPSDPLLGDIKNFLVDFYDNGFPSPGRALGLLDQINRKLENDSSHQR